MTTPTIQTNILIKNADISIYDLEYDNTNNPINEPAFRVLNDLENNLKGLGLGFETVNNKKPKYDESISVNIADRLLNNTGEQSQSQSQYQELYPFERSCNRCTIIIFILFVLIFFTLVGVLFLVVISKML